MKDGTRCIYSMARILLLKLSWFDMGMPTLLDIDVRPVELLMSHNPANDSPWWSPGVSPIWMFGLLIRANAGNVADQLGARRRSQYVTDGPRCS